MNTFLRNLIMQQLGVSTVVRAERIKTRRCLQLSISRVEAGSNTSTVTMRVVRGDEKGSLESERGRSKSTNPPLSESNKNLVVSPIWVLYSKTDWPTDHRS
jgi:hypothetical protein